MARVVHFELPADDLDRASRFYSEVFGWNFTKWDENYALIMTGEESEPGINGGLMKRGPGRDVTVNTVDVASVDDCVAKVIAQGGKVVAPKMPVPSVGYLAYCTDSEGNMFGMMEADPTAA